LVKEHDSWLEDEGVEQVDHVERVIEQGPVQRVLGCLVHFFFIF
jgi:hypothetical protein